MAANKESDTMNLVTGLVANRVWNRSRMLVSERASGRIWRLVRNKTGDDQLGMRVTSLAGVQAGKRIGNPIGNLVIDQIRSRIWIG